MARPMPRALPVTMAVLPDRSMLVLPPGAVASPLCLRCYLCNTRTEKRSSTGAARSLWLLDYLSDAHLCNVVSFLQTSLKRVLGHPSKLLYSGGASTWPL